MILKNFHENSRNRNGHFQQNSESHKRVNPTFFLFSLKNDNFGLKNHNFDIFRNSAYL